MYYSVVGYQVKQQAQAKAENATKIPEAAARARH
jgi:hypothetical protein